MTVRAWLDRNKVFFETLAAVILAVTGIIVSISAVTISQESNRIASYQADLIKLQNQPILRFVVEQVFNPAENKYTHDRLTISNEGSPLGEFQYQKAVFFKVEYGKKGQPLRTAMIPLIGYYDASFTSQNTVGELVKSVNYGTKEGNRAKAVQTIWDFEKFSEDRGAFGFAEIATYVRVSYRDIFEEFHEGFYSVGTHGTHKLDEEDGKKILEEFERGYTQGLLDISDVSAEKLYSRWLASIEKS